MINQESFVSVLLKKRILRRPMTHIALARPKRDDVLPTFSRYNIIGNWNYIYTY